VKVVILAGGLGTRLSEETGLKPKPMVEIGGKPILWHIMKQYSHFGYNEFVICLGYKGYLIKEYFSNYLLHQTDVTLDLSTGYTKVHTNSSDPWKVTLVDTGLHTMTASRIKNVTKHLNNEPFFLTYGDGVSDINISDLLAFHKKQKKIVTLSAIELDSRFGKLDIDANNTIKQFLEKPKNSDDWINGGFMVCEPELLNYIDDESSQVVLERAPLETIAREGQLGAFKHKGFWQPMDTLREKVQLEELWKEDKAPWKVWT
jgi:glucose-1-phosphate cytidylyltransferase